MPVSIKRKPKATGMTVAFLRRMRVESGTPGFSEVNLKKIDRPLSDDQRHVLSTLTEKDKALADEIQELWCQNRSYLQFNDVSDEQMCRIMNGLNAVGIDLLNRVEKADKEMVSEGMPVSKKRKYLNKAEWTLVGEFGVDTGQCWIGDPISAAGESMDDGVTVSTGFGDGVYPVYVRISKIDGRTEAVFVDFMGDAFGEVKEK